jgi:hypothetical protein
MKAVFGILLAGGGVFLLVMLMNGTLARPLGSIGLDLSGLIPKVPTLQNSGTLPTVTNPGTKTGTGTSGGCPSSLYYLGTDGKCHLSTTPGGK